MTINEVMQSQGRFYAGLRKFSAEETEGPAQEFVVLEGDSDGFLFFAALFTALANRDEYCSVTIHPTGAGSAHFLPGSNLGIILHRNDNSHGSKR